MTATCYDTSGTRMATCTSAGSIHVWDRVDGPDGNPGEWKQSAGWAAHDAPAKAVAFAGAEFGQCLACSFSDGTIRVWREAFRAPGPAAEAAAVAAAEEGAARWEQRASLRDGATPVCHIGFAPPEYGLQLAASGDDGVVRFYSPTDVLALSGWELCNEAEALTPGAACTALAWCRPTGGGGGGGGGGGVMMTMMANGGALSDNATAAAPPMVAVALTWPNKGGESDVRVLAYDEAGMRWRVVAQPYKGPLPATALAWAPSTDAAAGRGGIETIAAAIGTEVAVFRMEGYGGSGGGAGAGADGNCYGGGSELRTRRAATLPHHPAEVHGVDWNVVGNTLATSAGDGVVRVWAANMQSGTWEQRAQLVGE